MGFNPLKSLIGAILISETREIVNIDRRLLCYLPDTYKSLSF